MDRDQFVQERQDLVAGRGGRHVGGQVAAVGVEDQTQRFEPGGEGGAVGSRCQESSCSAVAVRR
ncbi:hypothetical protein STHAL_32895 [Streptomyces halstedii]|uniref:Uncharacterized protein n=1 Tax=Streptomyces halstedii TaxID=1944 RepID=A0ABS6U1E8_STRHA|nr:hypothetical protein [Streptomyces halstedii]MBV7674246.1 hypothetical protein [Streptomyces halstedii]